jgi:hypothetical protein
MTRRRGSAPRSNRRDIEAESSSAGEDVAREEAAARRHQEKAGEIEREL